MCLNPLKASLRLLARVHAAVGGGRPREVLGDDGLRRLDPRLLQLELVGLDGVEKVVVVAQRGVLVLGAELPEELGRDRLLVHDVVVALGGQRLLEKKGEQVVKRCIAINLRRYNSNRIKSDHFLS